MSVSPRGLARTSATHPWRMLGLWVVILALAAVLAPTLGDSLTTEMKFTNKPESIRADDLLEARLRGERPMAETIVVHNPNATASEPAFRGVVAGVLTQLTAMPEAVASAIDPLAAGMEGAGLVSADGHTVIIPVTMKGNLDQATDHVEVLLPALARVQAAAPGFEVLTVGDASMNRELTKISEEDLAKGEQIGLPVAIVILVVVLGALVAAGLPILLGLVSVFIAIGLAAIVGQLFDLTFFIVNMIGMIGLAVGIDYALFVISRYREERARGHEKLAAIEIAGATASKAVLFSGGTVILALGGMFIAPGTAFRDLGIGAVLVVIVAIAATLMLIPALLALLGDRIDWPRKRRYDAASVAAQQARDAETIHAGFWGSVTRLVMARPVISLVLAVTVLVGLALPYLDIRTGSAGVSALPRGTETRHAYELLRANFPAGTVSPVEIVVDGIASDPKTQAGIDHLLTMLAGDGTFGRATVTTNPAGDLTLISVPLTVSPDSTAAYRAIDRLRGDAIPMAFQGAPATVLVTGATAFADDFNHLADRFTPIVLAFVLTLSFLLLTLAFRSIVVPAKAIVMNLLSVGAAYGAIVLVFQKGIGAELFGFQQVDAIESWLPLFLFCVLFGLSMDYHVFLLSRIREHYDLTKRNGESVAVGLQATAKLITGAALIMVAVFGGFAAGRLVTLQQVGFGLAVAVLLDATIVRSVLVPASMALLGDRNWYLPRWLEWLPNLNIEGVERPAPAAAPAPVFEPAEVPAPVLGPVLMTSGDD